MTHSPDETSLEHVSQGSHSLSWASRLATLAGVVVPFIGLVAAVVLLWGWACDWSVVALLFVMYLLTGLGITVGYHRLFTHQSFETSRVVKFVLGILGSMAVQGPLLRWVALHRVHHYCSDDHGDPHSPAHHGHGVLGVLRGMWHAHLGWLFKNDPPDLLKYVKDLRKSRMLRWVSATFPLWVVAGLVLPTALCWLWIGGWQGAMLGFLWGGLVRVFLVHHVTWSINSVCHLWGRQPYPLEDQSKNNFIVGLLALGEGWHNNHHAFPTSARLGLHWWQIDLSYWVIRTLEICRLAWKVRRPRCELIAIRAE